MIYSDIDIFKPVAIEDAGIEIKFPDHTHTSCRQGAQHAAAGGKATAEAGLSWAEDNGKGLSYIKMRMQKGDCAGRAEKNTAY